MKEREDGRWCVGAPSLRSLNEFAGVAFVSLGRFHFSFHNTIVSIDQFDFLALKYASHTHDSVYSFVPKTHLIRFRESKTMMREECSAAP